jgi:hypothetical protein
MLLVDLELVKDCDAKDNDEARMTNDERSSNAQMPMKRSERCKGGYPQPQTGRGGSGFVIPSSLDLRHSSLLHEAGARCRVRTCDFLRVKQALYH